MTLVKTILVTGFGPFDNHEVNASWEAVKELYEMRERLHERHNVKLIIERIPVVYDHVAQTVPKLWEEHDPQKSPRKEVQWRLPLNVFGCDNYAMVVHVGVSCKAQCLTIERGAHGTGYFRADVSGKCGPGKCGDESSALPDFLETAIDVEDLCRKINDKSSEEEPCEACTSHDAGRYLCEYIYYQSLRKNPHRALFVHVPDRHVYPTRLTAKGLCEIIELLVESG